MTETTAAPSPSAGDSLPELDELRGLLRAGFSPDELRRVLERHDAAAAAALAGLDDADARAAETVDALARADAIDPALLELLEELKPERADELRELADRWRARESAGAASSGTLSPRRIIFNLVVGMMAFTTIIAAIGYWLSEPLRAVAELFVEHLGATGVMLGFYFPDGFTIPLPPDAFSALGLAGGLGFWSVVFWSSFGSVLGGVTGFTIGRRLSKTRWFRRKIRQGNGAAVHDLIERYGALGLAIAACTPLPYSLGTWAAGTTRMSYIQFFVISIPLRSVRVAFMLWLVELGLRAST